MRKYAILAALMALVVAVTSGCGLIVKDAEVDSQTVIIEVAGKTYVKAEVRQVIQNILDYQEYYAGMYGYSFDRTDADTVADAQESAINALIEEAVTEQKILEYGMDQFSDEELAVLNESVDETYSSDFDSVKSYFFADTELTGEELDAAVAAKMLEVGYGTKEEMLEQEKQSASQEKLRDMAIKDVTVTQEEIQAEYDSNVADAISKYAYYPTQYASDVSGGAIIYYRPSGYRYVKNLLVKISDDDRTALQSLSSQLTDDRDSLEAVQSAIAELPADSAEDTEDQAKSRTELDEQLNTLNTEIADLTAQLETLTVTAYGAVQPKVDEVLAKIAEGVDFDALIEEYGEDSGMKAEPQKSQGYLVCDGLTTYVEAFVTEAMALQKVGDISDPFRTDYGVHIVQYASDLEEGQAEYSEISDQIGAELLSTKQGAAYDAAVSQWIADAKAKVYEDRMKD